MVQLKVATLIHIWVDCLSGTQRIQCCPRISWSTRVIILRSATQAQRELRYFMLETSMCSHKLLWALAQLSKLHDLFKWQASRCRGMQVGTVYPGLELMLLKDCVSQSSVSQTPCSARNPTEAIVSCGEKCATLCRVYKLIMVSRVPSYGHLEYLVLRVS